MTFKFFKNNEINLNDDAYSNRLTGCPIKSGMTENGLSSLGRHISFQSSLGERRSPAPRGTIKASIRFITAVCLILMISTTALADDTASPETCADGAGTIITGAVTGHKYCKSHNAMNWFNAYAWCDASGRRLFRIDDCAFSSTSGTSVCHELKGVGDNEWVWTATPNNSSAVYDANLVTGDFNGNGDRSRYKFYTLCY